MIELNLEVCALHHSPHLHHLHLHHHALHMLSMQLKD